MFLIPVDRRRLMGDPLSTQFRPESGYTIGVIFSGANFADRQNRNFNFCRFKSVLLNYRDFQGKGFY